MGGAAGHPGDLLTLQTLHQGGLAVHCGGAVALLAVVVVTPRKHLQRPILLLDMATAELLPVSRLVAQKWNRLHITLKNSNVIRYFITPCITMLL